MQNGFCILFGEIYWVKINVKVGFSVKGRWSSTLSLSFQLQVISHQVFYDAPEARDRGLSLQPSCDSMLFAFVNLQYWLFVFKIFKWRVFHTSICRQQLPFPYNYIQGLLKYGSNCFPAILTCIVGMFSKYGLFFFCGFPNRPCSKLFPTYSLLRSSFVLKIRQRFSLILMSGKLRKLLFRLVKSWQEFRMLTSR